MEFNWLTINGKAGLATTPMIIKLGERIRIRVVNLGMDHHPMHIHGAQFYVTGTEGGRVPETAWFPHNTHGVTIADEVERQRVPGYPQDMRMIMDEAVAKPETFTPPGMRLQACLASGLESQDDPTKGNC
jgi:FtsP/CotA-like multicopper oxidase with cupredoxin domain